ncbi:unnamed protein product [Cyprideis torosa]|uniref:Uncharacterized protein n=1 Tax=Cyprideis torosa TaxID=163714 RepID=A0A7R8W893_9CRUS|nr:unnamed protein product [Cyprideis torosa]CAG0888356.1 unnamed protein product [Cyprideis torosa]
MPALADRGFEPRLGSGSKKVEHTVTLLLAKKTLELAFVHEVIMSSSGPICSPRVFNLEASGRPLVQWLSSIVVTQGEFFVAMETRCGMKGRDKVRNERESGKSYLSNFLADATESATGDYRPTKGVRILEFESPADIHKAEVELWDTSGDSQYESCWPAIQRDAGGVIFVYDPQRPESGGSKQLDVLHSHFVGQQGLKDRHCVVFISKRKDDDKNVKLSNTFSGIPQIPVNIETQGEILRAEFQRYLTRILDGMSKNREQAELNIIR